MCLYSSEKFQLIDQKEHPVKQSQNAFCKCGKLFNYLASY